MSEEKIYQRINDIDQKYEKRNDILRREISENRAEMNLIMNAYNGHISTITTSSAVLSERFNQMRIQLEKLPVPEKRPCEFFAQHIQDHKEADSLWKKPVIGGIVGGAFVTVTFILRGFFEWLRTKI